MSDAGSSITLVFYKLNSEWWKEASLNLLAAAAQFSPFTHVEIAIGNESGHGGMMTNVARVFNDAIGVELTQRTGRNPSYTCAPLHKPHRPPITPHYTISRITGMSRVERVKRFFLGI